MSYDTAIFRLRNAVKRFESADNAFELFVPQLEIYRGYSYVVMGRSGCGKTTLLDAMGMVSSWTSCEEHCVIGVRGALENVLRMSSGRRAIIRRREIGYILQQGGLLPYLTAWENILFPLKLAGRPECQRRAYELAERLGVSEQLQLRPAALSIGQRQRVCIVRALALRPALILADEPTGALDPLSAGDVRRLLLQTAADQGSAVIVVTHDVQLFSPYADVCLGFEMDRRGRETRSVLKVRERKEGIV